MKILGVIIITLTIGELFNQDRPDLAFFLAIGLLIAMMIE